MSDLLPRQRPNLSLSLKYSRTSARYGGWRCTRLHTPLAIIVSSTLVRSNDLTIINLGRLKFAGSAHESRDDNACLLLGFERDKVDALLAAFKRHGLKRAEIERYEPPK